MKKLITITLSVVLIICIAGIIFLLFQNNTKANQINALSNEIKKTEASLSQSKADHTYTRSKLTKTQTDLTKAQAEISTRDEKIKKLESDKSKLQNEKADLAHVVNRVFCGKTIEANDLKDITTNAGLVNLLTKTMEEDYNMTSVDTSFDVQWNNSKSAVFDVIGIDSGERFSYKAVVSWDFDKSQINAIFDIGQGCYYYVP